MDEAKSNTDISKEKTPAAVKWALGLSLCWFVALFLIMQASKACPGAETNAFWELRSSFLVCRPINEVADFLAGAFAPVAFLWLVATVFLQAQELQAQRLELRLSRQVAVESRMAMEAQAEEARQSAAHLGAQVKILQQESDYRERQLVDADVDAELAAMAAAYSADDAALKYESNGSFYDYKLNYRKYPSLDDQIRQMAERAETFFIECRAQRWKPWHNATAAEWRERISTLMGRSGDMSAAQRRRIASFDLGRLVQGLDAAAEASNG